MQPMPHTPADDEADELAAEAAANSKWDKMTENLDQARSIWKDGEQTYSEIVDNKFLAQDLALQTRIEEQRLAAQAITAQPEINLADASRLAQATLQIDNQAEQVPAVPVPVEHIQPVAHSDQLVSH